MVLWLLACSRHGFPADEPRFVDQALAARPLPAGTIISTQDIFWIRMPSDFVSSRALTSRSPIIGRRLTERMFPQEPFREERLSPTPLGTPFPADVPPVGDFDHPALDAPYPLLVILAFPPLSPGHIIVAEDLYAIPLLPPYVPDGVFVSPEFVVDRVVCLPILPDEMIRADRLISGAGCPDEFTGLPAP